VGNRLKKLAHDVKIDGFRRGKVPLSVVQRRFGDRVRQEVLGDLIQSSYIDALREKQVTPVSGPRIEPLETGRGKGLEFAATFEVFPEITIPSLDDVKIVRPLVQITDADVGEMVETLRKRNVTWKEVDRPAADGDRVDVRYQGSAEDAEFPGSGDRDIPVIIGSGVMLPGFEDRLRGAKPSEQLHFDLQIPGDYRVERLAGKTVAFQVEVRKVAEAQLPDVDAAFVKDFGVESGDLTEFRGEVRGNMQQELDQALQNRVKTQAMDVLLERFSLQVPRALIEQEIDRLIAQSRPQGQHAAPAGLSLPRRIFEGQAERRVRLGLIIQEIVRQNGIEVDPGRVRSRVEEIARGYDDPQAVIQWYYSNREQIGAVRALVLEDQVVDWVLARAERVEEPSTFAAIMKDPAAAQPVQG
jgi:trigger factor